MSKNDITGDRLVSRQNSEAFDEGFTRIFGETCGRCLGTGRICAGYQPTEVERFPVCPVCNGIGKVME
jgi:DnaJ-class molecular chaperone